MADKSSKRPATSKRAVKPRPTSSEATKEPPPAPQAFLEHVRGLTNRRAELSTLVAAELRRSKPQPGTQPAQVKREANLKALKTWHSVAFARLDDLRAGRTGSGAGARTIPATLEPQTKKMMRRLIVALSKNAARISTLEGAQRRWHVAAKTAREGIQLRSQTAREALGNPLRPDSRLHLKAVHATFMLEGNSPRIRTELREAAAQNPKSKSLNYWLARYEIMAGNYAAAHEAASKAGNYPSVVQIIKPLLESDSADAPWLTWPCNFYTYRYTLASDTEIRGMQRTLAELFTDPELEPTFRDTFHIPQVAIDALKGRAIDGAKALACLLFWNQANLDMERSKYASAARNYEDCQRAIIEYFAHRYAQTLKITLPSPRDESGSDETPSQQLENALQTLAAGLIRYNGPARQIWTFFRERYMTLTLQELQEHDWRRPKVVPLAYEFANPFPDAGEGDFGTALVRLLTQMSILKSLQTSAEKVEEKIDAPLLALALVFCPLGIAEANRLRRHFDEGVSQCRQLINRHDQFKILSEVIEKPFVKILKARILLDKADAQYKAGTLAKSPAKNPDQSLKYQGLEAAEAYQGVLVNFQDQGQYVNRVNAGLDSMTSQLQGLVQHTFHPIAVKETSGPTTLPALTPDDRRALALVGKKITIETITPAQGDYPDPNRRIRPHEPLLKIEPSGVGDTSPALLETNPVIYALIIEARARLLQMESGLNYLGYSDDYIPPWRFQFLLDRARYFAEHAKNAQREYLNFLSNAEKEEFQELTAAQNVEMEKSNIRLESARVEQVRFEVEVGKEAVELANLTAADAQVRFDNYQAFDGYADSLFGTDGPDFLSLPLEVLNQVPGLNELATGIGDLFSGGGVSNRKNVLLADAQRGLEEKNLELAIGEADQAAVVAQGQLAVAQAGLLVAGLQRAAAVLRHEFALQNLTFLRNRTLNAELWYRLSAAIRSVADTYLRYGIEMGFLAEQAYEFEADKRINVIRFDYDISDLGNMLAGDFLLRDLDTLEQNLIVGQRIRQQAVRYVLSLGREFPEALQELRARDAMTFSLRLEQLERRFPGLFNLRISSVEVLPLALMDQTRFSLELTHLGSGQVRLTAEPSPPPGPLGVDWLNGVEADWAIRLRTTPPETAVFSGINRQDLGGVASFFAANQRGAFEGLAGASAWQVDLSMKENRIVPDSLVDLLITFTLSGYYDSNLRDAVDRAPRTALATTSWFSGHLDFPDSFYEFNQTGRMEWEIRPDFFSLQGTVGELRNVAARCFPSQKRVELGRLICSYPIEFEVDATGNVQLLRELPRFSLTTNGLVLDATLNLPAGSAVTFDFGDDSGLLDSSSLPHTFSRPGRYEVLVRIEVAGRLTQYRAAVVASRQHSVRPPCVALPSLATTVVGGKVRLQPGLADTAGESLFEIWQIDNIKPDAGSDPVAFTLEPGRYVLRLAAIRPLIARFSSQQRFEPNTLLPLQGLTLASNRTFDVTTGVETTTALNDFGQHLFGSGALAPTDRWTFELQLEDNPFLLSVSSSEVKQHDLSELSDIMLALEYDVRDA